MPWLCRISIRRPRTVAAIALLIVLCASPGVLRLHVRTDGHALLPPHEADIITDARIREEFGLRDQVVILIQSAHPDGVFNTHTLTALRDLSQRLVDLPGIGPTYVTSIATEKNDRVVPGTLDFRLFLDMIPELPADMDRLRKDLREFGIYHGTLLSKDEKSTCVLVGIPNGPNRQECLSRIRQTVAVSAIAPDIVHIVGAPVAESLLGTHILEDLGIPSTWLGAGESTHEDTRGLPASLYGLRRWIARSIGLVPLAVLVMTLVFLCMFRRWAAVALPLMEVGVCIVFTFAMMGWCDVPVYLTIAVMPIILAATGITDEIHVFSRYRQLAADRPGATGPELAAAAIDEMWRPVVKTSATTAVGFLSFVMSDLKPVQAFGVFCCVGSLFCMAWSLSFVPACMAILPRRALVREGSMEGTPGSRSSNQSQIIFGRIAETFIRRRAWVLLLTAVIVIVSPMGIARLYVQDSWIDGFSPESEFRRATEQVNAGYFGTHLLTLEVFGPSEVFQGDIDPAAANLFDVTLVGPSLPPAHQLAGWFLEIKAVIEPTTQPMLGADGNSPGSLQIQPVEFTRLAEIEEARSDGNRLVIHTRREYGPLNFRPGRSERIQMSYMISPRPMNRPDVLAALCDLDAFIRNRTDCAVGGVLGPCEYLETLNFSTLARRDNTRRIPNDAKRVAWLWDQYRRLRGETRLRQIIDPAASRGLVTIFLNDANYIRTAALMAAIRDYEKQHLAPLKLAIRFGGDVAASQTLIGSIVHTQMSSVLGSLIGIFALTAFLFRSMIWGLIAVIPCSLAIAVNFAIMGWLNIPIGVATSMFAAMTLGIGVDHAIHLIERYRTERENGLAPRDAVIHSYALNGAAILTDALAICLGFGVMMLSQVPSNAHLGMLVIVCDLACVLGTLLLLPAILASRNAEPVASSFTY